MSKPKDYGLIFWMHLVVILVIWSSPLLINWKLIIPFMIIFYIQQYFFKGCFLTRRQFGPKANELTFFWYYLNKVGFKFEKKRVSFIFDYVTPFLILAVAFTLQEFFAYKPILPLIFRGL